MIRKDIVIWIYKKWVNSFLKYVEVLEETLISKSDLKNAIRIDKSKLAAKSDLTTLKAEKDKIDFDKLKTVPVDLSKLRNLVNNDVVKETVYDKLVVKINNIYTYAFALKTKYQTDKSGLEKEISDADKKIPDTSGLVEKTGYNSKISKIERKRPSISGLVTKSALMQLKIKYLVLVI